MISIPDLENLIKTRIAQKQQVSRFFQDSGISITIGTKSKRGLPVTVRISNDTETRYLDEIPNARELKEMVEFLASYIVVKIVHES